MAFLTISNVMARPWHEGQIQKNPSRPLFLANVSLQLGQVSIFFLLKDYTSQLSFSS
jgi:hypothetical protein